MILCPESEDPCERIVEALMELVREYLIVSGLLMMLTSLSIPLWHQVDDRIGLLETGD
jgi:hypothetical protein